MKRIALVITGCALVAAVFAITFGYGRSSQPTVPLPSTRAEPNDQRTGTPAASVAVSATASSAVGEAVTTEERAPADLTVDWPDQTAAYCARIRLPVRIRPPGEGRTAVLQARDGSGPWVTADQALLGSGGSSVLAVPTCQTPLGERVNELTWRVLVARTAGDPEVVSEEHMIKTAPAPPPCPTPQDITAVGSNPDSPLSKPSIRTTNPSAECSARLVLSAELTCMNAPDIVADSFVELGKQVSDSVVLGPGESGEFENIEVFSAAADQCRALYGDSANLTSNLTTTYAYAEEFFRE